jgi:putative ABC transport system permease protein
MERLFQDLRYGIRALLKKPGFTSIAVLTLALGIGANTAIFSVVNAVLLRPLPFKEPAQLVEIQSVNLNSGQQSGGGASPADFWDWQQQSQAFDNIAAFSGGGTTLTLAEHPESFPGASVSTNFFDTLGVKPLYGRAFADEEGKTNAPSALVLSYKLWQQKFAGDADVIGRSVKTATGSATIIGVMPPDFRYPYFAQVWTPMQRDAGEMQNRANRYFAITGRIKADQTFASAQAEIQSIAARLEGDFPQTNKNISARLVPLRETISGRVRSSLLILLGAVGFVLLIACANVASLMLARAESRRKEMAIRVAIGASRWNVIRQLLIESLLLALTGGSLGLLLALWGVDLLVAFLPQGYSPAFQTLEVRIDNAVLMFALLASLLTGLVFGLIPAWQASRPDINDTLKETGRSANLKHQRARGILVIAEVALALVLLAGSALLIQSFARLRQVDLGFEENNLLTMSVSVPFSRYPNSEARARFYKQLIDKISQTPGVESIALTCGVPFGYLAFPFNIEGSPLPSGDDMVRYDSINPDYFKALKARMISGREFAESDNKKSPNVAIINETLARQYFAEQEPIGKQISFNYLGSRIKCEIVGVAGNIRQEDLQEPAKPQIYVPYEQVPWLSASLVIRAKGLSAASLRTETQNAIWAVDKDQPAAKGETVEESLGKLIAEPRLYTILLGSFAALALMLAAVGIYGVISYSVAQRTHEIGIRMALGAQKRNVLNLIIRQGMMLVSTGIVIGLFAALALTRLMQSLLFGISATDPLTFVAVSLILAGVALVACFVPAHRATKTDPMIALRYE